MSSNAAIIACGTAGSGLTAAGGKFVKMSSLGVLTLADDPTDVDTIGVLLGNADSGADVYYQVSGTLSGMIAGGVITPGQYVTTNASGDVVAAVSTNAILGQYIPDVEVAGFVTVAAGDVINNIALAPVKVVLVA